LGLETGRKGNHSVSLHIRKYLFSKFNNKCQKCDWAEKHPITGNVPLEIHHVNGNCTYNKEINLELLCPNCHSLTNNFGSLNTGNAKRYNNR